MSTDARRQARFVQHQSQTQQNNTLFKRASHVTRAWVTRRRQGTRTRTWCRGAGLLCALPLWLSPRSMPTWSLVKAGPRLFAVHPWCRRWLSTSRPSAQASQTQQASSRWSDTLLLPKTGFPLYNDPSKDSKIKAKTTEGLYQWQVGTSPPLVATQRLNSLPSLKMPKARRLSSLTDPHTPMAIYT